MSVNGREKKEKRWIDSERNVKKICIQHQSTGKTLRCCNYQIRIISWEVQICLFLRLKDNQS